MLSSKKASYEPLTEVDLDADPAEQGAIQRDCDRTTWRTRKIAPSSAVHIAILCLELAFLALLIAGYAVLNDARRSLSAQSSLDGLLHLGSYNTTMRFQNNSDLLSDSYPADKYWRDLLESGGVVSLDTEWALEQGLRKSAASPTDSSQSIYQVDVFHSLHCLNAIRKNLMAKNAPPLNETHMLHCLDYIRHQLLCHPDLTLITTTDLEEFVLDEAHTCRDYGAVLSWVDRHRWAEFPEWLKAKAKGG